MSDDYLWNGEGEPDEEVRRLEELLGAFRMPRDARFSPRSGARTEVRATRWLLAIAAALFVLGVGVPAFVAWRSNTWHEPGALVPLRAGAVVTGTRIESGAIGVVDVAAGTRLRIVDKRRLTLEVGRIHASTTSPPGIFVVDTPQAQAIDLGCEYVLDVAADGSGTLRVTAGWVELARGYTQSLVPRGASATFDASGTLSAPVFDDAPPSFKDAVLRHDVARIVALARTRDAFTLLNLFSRTSEEERLMVYDRLAQLVPPPPSITRESMRWWSPGTTGDWWAPVMKASGIDPIKKKKKV